MALKAAHPEVIRIDVITSIPSIFIVCLFFLFVLTNGLRVAGNGPPKYRFKAVILVAFSSVVSATTAYVGLLSVPAGGIWLAADEGGWAGCCGGRAA